MVPSLTPSYHPITSLVNTRTLSLAPPLPRLSKHRLQSRVKAFREGTEDRKITRSVTGGRDAKLETHKHTQTQTRTLTGTGKELGEPGKGVSIFPGKSEVRFSGIYINVWSVEGVILVFWRAVLRSPCLLDPRTTDPHKTRSKTVLVKICNQTYL